MDETTWGIAEISFQSVEHQLIFDLVDLSNGRLNILSVRRRSLSRTRFSGAPLGFSLNRKP